MPRALGGLARGARAARGAGLGTARVSHPEAAELLGRAVEGDRAALARAISWIENEAPEAKELLDASFPLAGRATRLGITGPPGAGKSTLVARLAREYRE